MVDRVFIVVQCTAQATVWGDSGGRVHDGT